MTTIHRMRKESSAILLIAIASVVIGLVISYLDLLPWSFLEATSILLLLFLAVLPFLLGYYSRSFDPFEPVYLFCLATIVSFVIAPTLLLARGDIVNSGISFRNEAVEAILLSGLALFGFYVGYYLLRNRRLNEKPKDPSAGKPELILEHYVRRWAFAGLLVAIVLLIIWFRLVDIPLGLLNALAEDSYYGILWAMAETNILYLFMARVSLPALLLLAYPVLKSIRWQRVAVGSLWLLSLIFFLARGNRGITFRLLLATVVYYYLIRRRRPAVRTILITLVIFFLLAGGLVALRSRAYADISPTDLDIGIITGIVERDLTDGGGATGMMILLRVFPEKAGFIYGRVFEELLYTPIPRVLWPGKPIIRGVQNLAEHYVPRSHAPPIFGLFYAGFGIPGVMLSMAIFGGLSAWIYSMWRRRPAVSIYQVLLAVWLSLMWELYHRGGASWVTVNIVFSLGPILLVTLLARMSQRTYERRIESRSAAKLTKAISRRGEAGHV
jgi:oligosaccharide repeat unit polymerase